MRFQFGLLLLVSYPAAPRQSSDRGQRQSALAPAVTVVSLWRTALKTGISALMNLCRTGLRQSLRLVACSIALALLANLAGGQTASNGHQTVFEFAESGVTFHGGFEGARLNDCTRNDNGGYRLLIRPENEPINDSAWYAFKLTSASNQIVTVHLTYEGGKHRYHPKLSTNGTDWQPVATKALAEKEDSATFRVEAGPNPLWIAGQEIIAVREVNAWMDQMTALPFIKDSVIGESAGGRPMRKLTIREGRPDHAVYIVGRQHPPEVTGSMALMRFVETIAGPTDLAGRFRQRFEIAVVPLMNPDGVAAGYWRHNLNGVDLNRDWGPFAQPETRAVRDDILRYQSVDTPRLSFFLDFHSTQHDVFYIETGDEPVWPVDFPARWLEALAERVPDYSIRAEPRPGDKPYSKTWVRQTLRVPAIIYEMGDDTDRQLIDRVATTAAGEMMHLLLEEVAQ